MARLIYSMNPSLDGFINDREGNIDWTNPEPELHRFHNARTRELSAHLLGRRLYEVMTYWETADRNPELADYEREFAEIWQRLPKYVFSTTLTEVEGNSQLVEGDAAEQAARLKNELDGEIGVGGAGLAATLIAHDLIDEYDLFLSPILLGAGTPYFPPLQRRLELELVETKTFGDRVVMLRYQRPRA